MRRALMNTLLGGCASSMLFKHVREEQSLCYYCASTYDRLQGIMLIDSGVEAANAERTREEILRQLEALRQGQFSDDELEAARRSLIQGFTAMRRPRLTAKAGTPAKPHTTATPHRRKRPTSCWPSRGTMCAAWPGWCIWIPPIC